MPDLTHQNNELGEPIDINIGCAPKLGQLLEIPKRIKMIVGGRGSTKSTFAADYVLAQVSNGQLWCCGREFQNSIDESVHRLLLDEIERLELEGFNHDNNHIYHRESGGRIFYKGLSRNPRSVKSMLSGVDGLWIEEGDSLSQNTLKVLTTSLRLSAKDADKLIAGEDVHMPEVWITLNRGSTADPVSKKWLKRAEKKLAKDGVYQDDNLMIVQINYDEIPKKWFLASGLESERLDDKENMDESEYFHKWHGGYSDSVPNAIIPVDWFNACIDAHIKLGFEPVGVEVVSHDPSDLGIDTKGLAYRHGVVFLDVKEKDDGDVNEGADWAIEYCHEVKPDHFIWDGGGMGLGLRRQFNDALGPTRTGTQMFDGAETAARPDEIYEDGRDTRGDKKKRKRTNKETFVNQRAQFYWELRDRCWRTHQAVIKGKYFNPDELISFSSEIEEIDLLRAEICRIPKKYHSLNKFQVMNKKEMKDLEIDSPNMADSVMMNLAYNPEKIIVRKARSVGRKKFGA